MTGLEPNPGVIGRSAALAVIRVAAAKGRIGQRTRRSPSGMRERPLVGMLLYSIRPSHSDGVAGRGWLTAWCRHLFSASLASPLWTPIERTDAPRLRNQASFALPGAQSLNSTYQPSASSPRPPKSCSGASSRTVPMARLGRQFGRRWAEASRSNLTLLVGIGATAASWASRVAPALADSSKVSPRAHPETTRPRSLRALSR